jgi:hypothetical protein
VTHAMLYLCLVEAEERVANASDAAVRDRSAETVSLVKQRMAMEGLTRDALKNLAGQP